jgi:hypothetical protein
MVGAACTPARNEVKRDRITGIVLHADDEVQRFLE